jgi:hypothetical protein
MFVNVECEPLHAPDSVSATEPTSRIDAVAVAIDRALVVRVSTAQRATHRLA